MAAGDGRERERGHGRRLLSTVALLLVWACLSCSSGPAPTLVERGDAALAEGDLVAAEGFYRAACEHDSDDIRAWHGRAKVALADDEPETSLRYYVEVARVDRLYLTNVARFDYTMTLMAAGRERLAAGRSDGAVRALKAARRVTGKVPGLDEDLGRALTLRGERLVVLGHQQRALADFREAIEYAPGEATPYVGAAQILLASGRKDEAMALLADARRKHPDDTRVRALTMEAVGLH
jgi:tetratricopeptide (TPR) repeat protein